MGRIETSTNLPGQPNLGLQTSKPVTFGQLTTPATVHSGRPSTSMGPPQLEIPQKRRLAFLSVALMLLQHLAIVISGATVQLNQHQPLSWNVLLVKNLSQWDGKWMMQIAQYGYVRFADAAFFPAYPTAIRMVHDLTRMGYAVSGIVISGVAFAVALYFLGLLVGRQFGSGAAFLSMTLLTVFPTAFFYSAVYTESLFLACSLAAVYFSYTHRFLAAGAFAMVAALTRNTGGLLEIILILDYIAMCNPRQEDAVNWRRGSGWWKYLNMQVAGLAIPPIGVGIYLIWLKLHTGYFLAFLHAEAIWHRTHQPVWSVVYGAFRQLILPGGSGSSLIAYHALEVLIWCVMVAALGIGIHLVWTSCRQGHPNYTQIGYVLYLAATLWICSTEPARTHTGQWDFLLSVPRLALMMFPAFIYLALIVRSRWQAAKLLAISSGAFVAVYGVFCMGSFIA